MRPELEIYSDFNCTWCYFDKPVIADLVKQYEIEIRWRAFPLHPDIPEGGMPIIELFGYNEPLMAEKMGVLEGKAAALGLPLAKRTMISDSRPAQELGKWAETLGHCDAFREAVYTAYFGKGLDIADLTVLADIAQEAGLPGDDAVKVIDAQTFGEEVEADWEKSEKLAVMVAPTYIMNGQRLAGSQSFEALEQMMIRNGAPRR
ncbi:MAG TPA: hypothetical protein DHV36_16235 [Desulfobacteraceae bacterium]|nr:hypothetical protein [Desulfobacteraceae bacterium]|tara:strand:+ start:2421 stop:3032 length:612 start_codon:yes stop_codon:yes gene_type:complete